MNPKLVSLHLVHVIISIALAVGVANFTLLVQDSCLEDRTGIGTTGHYNSSAEGGYLEY